MLWVSMRPNKIFVPKPIFQLTLPTIFMVYFYHWDYVQLALNYKRGRRFFILRVRGPFFKTFTVTRPVQIFGPCEWIRY